MLPDEPEPTPVRASYLPFLEGAVAESQRGAPTDSKKRRRAKGATPRARRAAAIGFVIPRRKEAVESLRVKLAPEQLYWLRLVAARAGRKVDESTIIAAALQLLERLNIEWRGIRSRDDLAQMLAQTASALAAYSRSSPGMSSSPPSPASSLVPSSWSATTRSQEG